MVHRPQVILTNYQLIIVGNIIQFTPRKIPSVLISHLQAQYMGSPYHQGFYGNRNNCPIHIISSLASIIDSLYGSSVYPGFGGGYGFGGLGVGYSPSTLGYQATAGGQNPYAPVCPWPLFENMLQQITQYVSQMRAAQQGTPVANDVFSSYGSLSSGRLGSAPMRPFRK